MDFYLQFGWGMMGMSRDLIRDWNGGTVILSPRDLEPKQLEPFSKSINTIENGRVLFDPQFYLPHSDHIRLRSHDYWPSAYSTGAFFVGPALDTLLSKLKHLNDELDSAAAILPGLLANEIDGDWLNIQNAILNAAKKANFSRPLCQTIALSADACRSEEQIVRLLEHSAQWKSEVYYLVCEHPRGSYLVTDSLWLSNLLDVIAGLKLLGSKVVVGYSNHQMLIAAAVKADAIASGTWMNVRAFPPEKFREALEEEERRKATWYYCPQGLSEYKLPMLDIAKKVGLLDQLLPVNMPIESAVALLFDGGQPSTVGLTEPQAFRHYLNCLKHQTGVSVKQTFDQTIEEHDRLLDEAEALLKTLTGSRIKGQLRDFSEAIEVNRSTLGALIATRGGVLRRRWSTI